MSTWNGDIIGHRGAAGLAPENTLVGFETAIALGVDMVEFDVRATLDGAVVFHDVRLDRFSDDEYAGLGKSIGRLSTGEVVRLDVGRKLGRPGCFVPTYDAVLSALKGRVRMNVEVKGSGADGMTTLRAVLSGLARHDIADALVSSFHEPVLAAAREQACPVARAFIADERTSGDPVAIAQRVGAVALHADESLVDESLLARCHAAGLLLRAWTVDEEDTMRRFMEMGVDGIVTDLPDLAIRVAGRVKP